MENLITDNSDKMSVQNTSMDCATACFNAGGNCTDGWSYQIATKTCFFLDNIDLNILRPNYHLIWANMTLGWATGRKSCKEPGGCTIMIWKTVKEKKLVS